MWNSIEGILEQVRYFEQQYWKKKHTKVWGFPYISVIFHINYSCMKRTLYQSYSVLFVTRKDKSNVLDFQRQVNDNDAGVGWSLFWKPWIEATNLESRLCNRADAVEGRCQMDDEITARSQPCASHLLRYPLRATGSSRQRPRHGAPRKSSWLSRLDTVSIPAIMTRLRCWERRFRRYRVRFRMWFRLSAVCWLKWSQANYTLALLFFLLLLLLFFLSIFDYVHRCLLHGGSRSLSSVVGSWCRLLVSQSECPVYTVLQSFYTRKKQKDQVI